MPDNILMKIRDYFAMGSADFAREWKQLTPGDKAQIKDGLTNGTLTY